MKIISLTLYSFSELTQEAKKKALAEFQDINVSFDWWEFTYDWLLEDAGIIVKSFDLYRRGVEIDVSETFLETANLIQANFPSDSAFFTAACNYLDDYAAISYDFAGVEDDDFISSVDSLDSLFLEKLQRAVLNVLQTECDYLTSDRSVIETIEANCYWFTEKGERFLES